MKHLRISHPANSFSHAGCVRRNFLDATVSRDVGLVFEGFCIFRSFMQACRLSDELPDKEGCDSVCIRWPGSELSGSRHWKCILSSPITSHAEEQHETCRHPLTSELRAFESRYWRSAWWTSHLRPLRLGPAVRDSHRTVWGEGNGGARTQVCPMKRRKEWKVLVFPQDAIGWRPSQVGVFGHRE